MLEALQSGKSVSEAMAPMIKRVMEAALEGEMAAHLDEAEEAGNRRNGKARKRVKSALGEFELETPRDRDGSFEPQLIRKRQTVLTDELADAKILGLYAGGMSYADIRANLEEIYRVGISAGAISKITDRLIPELQEWRERPLDAVYAVLLIACVDGLKGFPDAINALFPQTEIQLCVIHQTRHSLRYVASKDPKDFVASMKNMYRAPSKAAAEEHLLRLEQEWEKNTPSPCADRYIIGTRFPPFLSTKPPSEGLSTLPTTSRECTA